ncbi:hypothetical protein Cfor_09108 [Coptotermes formosanus]|uniref:Uncharacterized protein n=1 Tax=Coptotermes formosanus TaxID=36987 RepID=A0A6L2PV13_COPFO|nr:hypothetical protein Cfor_09108 [Coptotermes formosanus]
MAALVGRCLRHKISFVPVRAVHAPSAGEHSGGGKLWRNLSFFVAFPAVGLCMVNAYLKHQEEHHHGRPEFIAYEHLRIRNKVSHITLQYISHTCLLYTLCQPVSSAKSFNFPVSSVTGIESMHCKVGMHLSNIYFPKCVELYVLNAES